MEGWQIVTIAIGTVVGNGLLLRWLKAGMDRTMAKQADMELDLAKNYSTSTMVLQTISLINAPVQQSIESLKEEMHSVKTEIKGMEEKLDLILINQARNNNGVSG